MHQIQATIDSASAAFKAAADANPVFLSVEEKRAALVELKLIESQAVELRLRIEASAQDLADQDCARDVGAVLVAAGLDDPRHAHGEVKLAVALEGHEPVRAALAEGRFTVAHAQAIVQSLDALPDDVDAEMIAKAESQLCAWAEEFTPRDVRRLGQHIVSVIDPEAGEAAEARALERLEADSQRKATLSIKPRGDGMTQIYGLVPDAVGARLVTVLESFAQPRKTALEAEGKTRPRNRLLAEALESLLERIDPDILPAHGGDATTVIVTVPLESLRSQLGVATMADGTLITAGEARRLACTASIIPAVLGGNSEILDLGRTRRLFSPPQRKALGIRDKHCRAEGCTVPATWCDSHHLDPWSDGGKTDLNSGVLLCGHHHRRIHDPRYEASRLPNGDFRFHLRR